MLENTVIALSGWVAGAAFGIAVTYLAAVRAWAKCVANMHQFRRT